MYKVVSCKDYVGGFDKAITYIHSKWGSPKNLPFYYDAAINAPIEKGKIPKFFVLLNGDEIIGCYGLIANDFISRHDLTPWLCSLFIEPEERGNRLSELLFEHAKTELKTSGYKRLYLTTDHDGFYEKFGWTRMEDGYDPSGEKTRIYQIDIG